MCIGHTLYAFHPADNCGTSSKIMHLMLQKAKTQNVRVWNRESFLIKKAPTEKIGALILKSILRKYRVQVSLMSREGKMGRAVL